MATVKCQSCGAEVKVPEKKTGLWWGIGCLIAALGLPFIIAVIGLLAAIAIPSFVKARDTAQRTACVANMRVLDHAKEEAALAHSLKAGDTVTDKDLAPYVKGAPASMVCPKGGHYTLNPIGQDPECSEHGALSDAGARAPARSHRHVEQD
jgi:hypothetical protein